VTSSRNHDHQTITREFDFLFLALASIFPTNLLRRPGSENDAALDSHFDLGGMYSYSPASKYSPALTRLAKLVSPFQGCLREPANSRQSPPRSLGPLLVPHPPSRPHRHDQHETSELAPMFHPNHLRRPGREGGYSAQVKSLPRAVCTQTAVVRLHHSHYPPLALKNLAQKNPKIHLGKGISHYF